MGGESVRAYFWRSYRGAEVDYLAERGGTLRAYELKWGEGRLSRGARSFEVAYAEALGRPTASLATVGMQLLNRESYLEFALGLA